jgi:hypothetical protein
VNVVDLVHKYLGSNVVLFQKKKLISKEFPHEENIWRECLWLSSVLHYCAVLCLIDNKSEKRYLKTFLNVFAEV